MDNIKRDFGVTDEKSRAIGAMVVLNDEGFPKPFGFRPWATRAGKAFGAIRRERWFNTKAERDEAIETYFTGAQKRALKTARAKYGDAAPTVRV